MVLRRGFVFVVAGVMLLTLVAGIAVAQNFNIIQCEDEDPEVPCVGTRGADRIIERDGSKHDDIRARRGSDVVDAAEFGDDRDEVRGGRGADRINVEDGDGRDEVNCGNGDDIVAFDKGDEIDDNCEDQRGPGGNNGGGGGGNPVT